MLSFKDLFQETFDEENYFASKSLSQIVSVLEQPVNSSTLNTQHLEATAYPVCKRDLSALHHLVISRKVKSIMEFGIGKSTAVLCHGLKINNKNNYASNSHIAQRYLCYSIDCHQKWINVATGYIKSLELEQYFLPTCSESYISTFESHICSYYAKIPCILPDLIYLDGPHHDSPINDINGFSTSGLVNTPMSADILRLEFFLEPGTLIVIDGRAANARFLCSHLKRNWSYLYVEKFDQHYFELQEPPFGERNHEKIMNSLGVSFFHRLSNTSHNI